MNASNTLGFVGLGVMGEPICRNILKAHPGAMLVADLNDAAVDRLVGARGEVRNALAPTGYIFVRGELWRAEVEARADSVSPGRHVRIVRTRGLTLIVEPENNE